MRLGGSAGRLGGISRRPPRRGKNEPPAGSRGVAIQLSADVYLYRIRSTPTNAMIATIATMMRKVINVSPGVLTTASGNTVRCFRSLNIVMLLGVAFRPPLFGRYVTWLRVSKLTGRLPSKLLSSRRGESCSSRSGASHPPACWLSRPRRQCCWR